MPVEISSLAQLLGFINSPKVTVVDFYATWCGPCKMVAPQFEQMGRYFDAQKVVFCKVDVDRNQDCAQRYQVTAMPTFMVFRAGNLVESIRGANMPRLQQVIDLAVSQVQSTFSGQGRAVGSTNASRAQSSLLNDQSAARAAQSKADFIGPIEDPITDALCRISAAIAANDPIQKKDACETVYEALKKHTPLGSAVLPYLCSKVYNPQAFTAVLELIRTMAPPQADDADFVVWNIAKILHQSLISCTAGSSSGVATLRGLVNLTRTAAARAALVNAQLFVGSTPTTAALFERRTLLGAALGMGLKQSLRVATSNPLIQNGDIARQFRIKALLEKFPLDAGNPRHLDATISEKVIQETRIQLESLAGLVFPAFRELLGDKDASRTAALSWISSMLQCDEELTKSRVNEGIIGSMSGAVTLMNVLVELALPITSAPNFDPSTIPIHYVYDPTAAITFGKDVERIAHFSEEYPLPPLPADAVATNYAPKVQLFYAAVRAIGIVNTSLLLQYERFERHVRYPVGAQERHYCLAECAEIKALLGSPTLAAKLLRFLNGVAKFLLRIAGARADGSLPARPPLAWQALPQSIVDDVIRGTKLLTTLRVTSVNVTEIHDIVSLMLVLMGNSTYFPKAHTHALFPPFLISLLQSQESGPLLQRHPWFHEHIVKGCIMCYVAMEKSVYEKVQTRFELSHCLREFLKNPSLCTAVKAEFDAGYSEVLERFSHMVTADVNASVDSIVSTLQTMNGMVASGKDVEDAAAAGQGESGAAQRSGNGNQRGRQGQRSGEEGDEDDDDDDGNPAQQRPRTYAQLGDELKSNLMLFDVSVDVFIQMTIQFPNGVAQNLVAQQIAQMLARSLTTFVGPKCRDLVIRNAEEYGFEPRKVLQKLISCLVQFQGSKTFIKALCVCGVPVKEIYDAMGSIVHRRLVPEDLCVRLTAMYSAMVAASKEVEDDTALWDDAPDWALDVLLSTPLIDPVAIPTEVKDVADLLITNRSTLHHALLTEPKNPYTKEYLDEAMVTAFNAKPEIAEFVVNLKQRIADWLTTARASRQR